MFHRARLRVLCLAAIACVVAGAGSAWGQGSRGDAVRTITRIAGDLYRFANNNHRSVFLVTPAGVIVADPINAAAAAWLKAEIARRFAKPVKYVIYSHHHADHASGGRVFADTARFIGHEKMKAASARPVAAGFPPPLRAMDADRNGVIERAEARGPLAANFAAFDSDGDGAIGTAEFAARRGGDVVPPDITFADTYAVELGGKRVELSYVGRNHTDNSIVMRFVDERVLYAVDFVTVKRLPYRGLRDSYLPDWIESLRRVEAMDFDILAPGHGALGGKADVVENRRYLEDLVAAVKAQIAAGKTLAEMRQRIRLDRYKDWGQYDAWLGENIAGVHRILTQGR